MSTDTKPTIEALRANINKLEAQIKQLEALPQIQPGDWVVCIKPTDARLVKDRLYKVSRASNGGAYLHVIDEVAFGAWDADRFRKATTKEIADASETKPKAAPKVGDYVTASGYHSEVVYTIDKINGPDNWALWWNGAFFNTNRDVSQYKLATEQHIANYFRPKVGDVVIGLFDKGALKRGQAYTVSQPAQRDSKTPVLVVAELGGAYPLKQFRKASNEEIATHIASTKLEFGTPVSLRTPYGLVYGKIGSQRSKVTGRYLIATETNEFYATRSDITVL